MHTSSNVKAGGITSRLKNDRPGKTNFKEQNVLNADERTLAKLRQNQMILAPMDKRR